jgi:signal transduction histidine kinase
VYRAHPDIGDSLRRAMAGESFATMAQVGGIAFETYYRPLHDAERAIVGAVGVAIDVTQRVQAEEALRRSETITTSLLDAMPCTLYRIDGEDLVLTVRPDSLEVDEADGPAVSRPLHDIFSAETAEELDRCLHRALETSQAQNVEFEVADDGGRRYFDAQVVPSSDDQAMLVVRDVTERRQLEVELRHAQKLEAIGRLAAGLAHEINTPVQFVGDNMNFLQDAFTDLLAIATSAAGEPAGVTAGDWAFLQAEVPLAIAQTQEGIHRVSTIVRALKSFAHPSGSAHAPADINKALQDTLIVAGSEYRMIADLHTELADLPPVVCHLSDLNQVFLNLLVNASHAIADTVGARGGRGLITVRTRVEGEAVRIEIVDTGDGIPTDIRQRVFDPFFTTKEVGRGTGQGLAFARSIVNDRHDGSITFACPPEGGTVFTILLPLAGEAPQGAQPDQDEHLVAAVR